MNKKYDIPNNKIDDYVTYQDLFLLGDSRTPSQEIEFDGLYNDLKDYMPSSQDWNDVIDFSETLREDFDGHVVDYDGHTNHIATEESLGHFKKGEGISIDIDGVLQTDVKVDGTYPNLRAQATTKADVELSDVDNLDAATIRSGTTKSDVGLSDVQNYDIATEDEAEVGTINTKYMTPLRVKESIINSKSSYPTVNDFQEYPTPASYSSMHAQCFYDNKIYYSWRTTHNTTRYYRIGYYDLQNRIADSGSSSTNSSVRNMILHPVNDEIWSVNANGLLVRYDPITFAFINIGTPVASSPYVFYQYMEEDDTHVYYMGDSTTLVKVSKTNFAVTTVSLVSTENRFCLIGDYIVTLVGGGMYFRVRRKSDLGVVLHASDSFSTNTSVYGVPIPISNNTVFQFYKSGDSIQVIRFEINPATGLEVSTKTWNNAPGINYISTPKNLKINDDCIAIFCPSSTDLREILFDPNYFYVFKDSIKNVSPDVGTSSKYYMSNNFILATSSSSGGDIEYARVTDF